MFDAGSVIGKVILDTAGYVSGINQVSTGNDKLKKGFDFISKAALAAGAAIASAVTASVLKANQWQKEFSNVTTVVDTASVNVQAMAKQMLLLDGRLGSATDLTNGLYQALSASVEPAKAVQFVTDSAKFAKAALVDTNTAVDVITTGLNAYGMEADQAALVSDKFFQVVMLGKTTGQELSAVIGNSIPLAANFGISLDELGASIAIMTQQGIKSAQATTQFNSAVSAFIKPSEAMAMTIKQLGYESGSAMVKQLGFKGALDAVVQSTGGSNEKLAEMFQNVEALRGVMALTGTGAAKFGEVLKSIEQSAGSTETAFKKQETTFESLKNQLESLAIVGGNIAKTFVDEIAVGATQSAKSMLQFLVSSKGAELVSNIIGNVAAGFEVLKKVADPLINVVFKEAKKIWDTLVTALNDVFGKTKDASGGFNLLAGAVQIVVSVIKVISNVINGAIKSISTLIEAIKASGGVIGSFFEFLAGKKKWSDVEKQTKAAGDAFKVFNDTVKESTEDVWNSIFDEAKKFKENQQKMGADLTATYKVTFTNVSNNVQQNYDSMITGQDNFVQQTIDNINQIGNSLETIPEKTNEIITQSKTYLQAWIDSNKESWDRLGQTASINAEYELQIEQELYDEREKLRIANEEKEKKALEDRKKLYRDTYNEIVGIIQTTSGYVFDIISQVNTNQATEIENRYAVEKKAIEDSALTEEQTKARMVELDKKFASERAALKKKEFVANQIAAVIQATIQTANAIVNTLATPFLPPWVSIPLAVTIGALGAAQIGAIASQPIPEFAQGGTASGLALVGEQGPELAYFNQPARIYPANETANMLGGRKSITMNNQYYVQSDNQAELISRQQGVKIQRSMRSF